MTSNDRITLYYSPQSRATGTRVLLEELGAPYDLHVLNMKAGEQRQPAYLAINPLGKVPAIRHGEALVTEQVAIYIYLADLFPEAGLTPALDDPSRGPYLRWIAYYGSSFEPALIDKFMKREPAPPTQSPYSDYDTMLGALEAQLSKGPYLLGERMTAADILWGVAFSWTMMFGLVPRKDVFVPMPSASRRVPPSSGSPRPMTRWRRSTPRLRRVSDQGFDDKDHAHDQLLRHLHPGRGGLPARTGEEPPPRAGIRRSRPAIRMIAEAPYKYTSDDVIFATSARAELDAKATKKEKSRPRRSSPGAGVHEGIGAGQALRLGRACRCRGRIAIYAVDSKRYQALAGSRLKQVRAMRSKRA